MEQFTKNIIETPSQKIDKLEALLSGDLHKKVYLTHRHYGKNYMLSTSNWGNSETIVDGEDDESTKLLTDIYNEYIANKPLGEERLYDEPGSDPTTNSVTEETMNAASFILKDFLDDMKKNLSSKE